MSQTRNPQHEWQVGVLSAMAALLSMQIDAKLITRQQAMAALQRRLDELQEGQVGEAGQYPVLSLMRLLDPSIELPKALNSES